MPELYLRPTDADTNGANVAAKNPTAGTNFDWNELDYDATTQEHADWNFPLDAFYNGGTIYIDIYWKTVATSGNVVWQANFRSISDGQLWDGVLGSDFWVSDTAQGTTEYMGKTTITCSSPSLTAGAASILRISRDADSTHATDNMAGDAKFLFAKVRYEVAG